MNITHTITPSRLWANAANINPRGEPSAKADGCIMCAAHISPGDLALPAITQELDESFNNGSDCHHSGGAICGHCSAIWESEWMQGMGCKSYAVQGQDVYVLTTSPDIAAFVLTPPATAYVAIFNNRQQAHMIWRTPVALPSPYLLVRADDDIIQIDRVRVMDGVRAWQKCIAILKEVGLPKATPFLLHSVYKLNSELLAHPLTKAVEAIEKHSAEGIAAVKVLQELTIADWWALNALKTVDMDQPSTWPCRRTLKQAKTENALKKNKITAEE